VRPERTRRSSGSRRSRRSSTGRGTALRPTAILRSRPRRAHPHRRSRSMRRRRAVQVRLARRRRISQVYRLSRQCPQMRQADMHSCRPSEQPHRRCRVLRSRPTPPAPRTQARTRLQIGSTPRSSHQPTCPPQLQPKSPQYPHSRLILRTCRLGHVQF
jgi:hypothetical protein